MTERIIKKLGEITGLDTKLRLSEKGGFALYTSGSEAAERFIDGGGVTRQVITLKCRGSEPAALFKAAEDACNAVSEYLGDDICFEVSSPPRFESCSEAGCYIVRCDISAEYIYGGDDNEADI